MEDYFSTFKCLWGCFPKCTTFLASSQKQRTTENYGLSFYTLLHLLCRTKLSARELSYLADGTVVHVSLMFPASEDVLRSWKAHCQSLWASEMLLFSTHLLIHTLLYPFINFAAFTLVLIWDFRYPLVLYSENCVAHFPYCFWMICRQRQKMLTLYTFLKKFILSLKTVLTWLQDTTFSVSPLSPNCCFSFSWLLNVSVPGDSLQTSQICSFLPLGTGGYLIP